MNRTESQWIEEYEKRNALWIHDGNSKRPHALLTSEKHSNGFFNSRLIIPDELLMREAASDLLTLLKNAGGFSGRTLNAVVGPKTGGTKLAEFINDELTDYISNYSFFASPENNAAFGKRTMVFSERELKILSDKSVLLCDDVITTSGSVDLMANAVEEAGGIVLPFILVLVNRSGLKEVSGRKIITLINHPMPIWTEEECKAHYLCAQGSEAIRPKGTPEWARLNAKY